LSVVGATPDAEEAQRTRARAKEVSEVVQGLRNAQGTKNGPIIQKCPLKLGKPVNGREVAAKYIYEKCFAVESAKGL
jgi:hypothetical protein